jgi:hypothetical protein
MVKSRRNQTGRTTRQDQDLWDMPLLRAGMRVCCLMLLKAQQQLLLLCVTAGVLLCDGVQQLDTTTTASSSCARMRMELQRSADS